MININAGGIVGAGDGDDFSPGIYNCYSLGNITGQYSGGICGGYSYNGIISNCYSTGNISADNAGGICGDTSPGTFNNCYVLGLKSDTNNGYIVGTDSDGATINYCYALQATNLNQFKGGGDTSNITNSGFGGTTIWPGTSILATNMGDSGTYYLYNNGNSFINIWADSSGISPPSSSYTEPFLLTNFTEYPWNHTTYNSTAPYILPIMCYVQGTKILTKNGYIPIEQLKSNNLIKTTSGYKSIYKIYKSKINLLNNTNLEKYAFRKVPKDSYAQNIPFEDFYITRMHSLLFPENYDLKDIVNERYFSEIDIYKQYNKIPKFNKILALHCTPNFCSYAYPDEFKEKYGSYTIEYYHLILRTTNKREQFVIYANGLPSESCNLDDYNTFLK